MNFSYSNIKFKKHELERWLIVTGEAINNTNKNFSSVVFKLTLFTRNTPIGSTGLTINGFSAGQVRPFEAEFYDLDYNLISGAKLRCEFFAEHAY